MTSAKTASDATIRKAESRAQQAEAELASLKASMPGQISAQVRREIAAKVADAERITARKVEKQCRAASEKEIEVTPSSSHEESPGFQLSLYNRDIDTHPPTCWR